MSISYFFTQLGAPLRNIRWSWGANDSRGRTIVRAWSDETHQTQGATYILIARHTAYTEKQSHPGYRERLGHLAALKMGAPTYALIVDAKDIGARPRAIKSFDPTCLWRLGKVIDRNGDEYAEMLERVPLSEFLV